MSGQGLKFNATLNGYQATGGSDWKLLPGNTLKKMTVQTISPLPIFPNDNIIDLGYSVVSDHPSAIAQLINQGSEVDIWNVIFEKSYDVSLVGQSHGVSGARYLQDEGDLVEADVE
jgi:hypothetical protein